MYNELSCYDKENTPQTVQELLFVAIEYGVKGISIPPYHFSNVRDFIPHGMIASIPVDYPAGMSDKAVRLHSVANSIKKGATALDLVLNNYPILAAKKNITYDELNTMLDLCKEHSITLRVMLEYNIFERDKLITIANEIREVGIEYIYPATGQLLDSFEDNLAISVALTKEAKINVISNGNIWKKSQYETAGTSGIFGVRFRSIGSVKNILSKIGVS